jgi:hypothetical protein
MRAIATGAPYRICCSAVGIAYDTFMDWKATDPEFELLVEQAASKTALRLLRKIEAQVDDNFAAGAWLLERRWPELFSRPEVQLNLIQQNNVAHDHLTIVISAEEAKELNARGEETREKVRAMFAEYQQRRGGKGNGAGGQRTVEVQAEPVKLSSSGELKKPVDLTIP